MPAGQGIGRGMGKGGQRMGMGPVKECRCPNCGYTAKHQRGQPCANQTCPECQTRMVGI